MNGKTGKNRLAVVGAAALATSAVFAMLDDDAALKAARKTLAKMTLEEKVLMLGGSGTQTIAAVPRVGIAREWRMHGNSSTVRGNIRPMGWSYEQPTTANTALPSASALAQTWDVEWARRHGEVLGAEMRDRGVDQLLSPGVNIARTPLCGRNWECLGEDPCLAATMVVPMIRGVQSYDVAATVKHFCLNSQELNRMGVDTVCDARTLNEIYLPAFRAAIKDAGVLSVMTSYNKVNGLFASENRYLQDGILRDRWGFKGMIVSDWGGMHSTAFAANNGTGLEMNAGREIQFMRNLAKGTMPLADAVRANLVPQATVDEMALHTLYMMAKTGFLTGAPRRAGSRNTREHQLVARQEAADSVVLLRNDDGLLPLKLDGIRKLLVIGTADNRMCRIGRGQSAESNPPYEVTLYGALTNRLAGVEVQLLPHGVGEARLRPAAEQADAVIVFIGTDVGDEDSNESEGHDRSMLGHGKMLDRISSAIYGWKIRRLVTVSRSGSPIAYVWTDRARTLLHTSFGGMEWGNALLDVILGDVNPSGRLCHTWPRAYAETGVGSVGTYNPTNVIYNERFYVGYRWNDRHGVKPLFPFGYGLSYTAFGYGEVKAKGLEVSVPVTNTGKVAGKEVVQFYLSYPEARVERCVKDLRGFAKVSLKPGETKVVTHRFTERDFAYWDDFAHRFRTDSGRYEVLVGASAADIRSRVSVNLPRDVTFDDFAPGQATAVRPCPRSGEVREAVDPFIRRGEIAGVVSILSDPDYNLAVDCLGWADAENKVPMAMDTVFAVFSMSKTFTGCALMVAIDKGILKLGDPVAKYLPEFAGIPNKITIRDCMCHVTGIDGGTSEMIHCPVPLREQARIFATKGKCVRKVGAACYYGNPSVCTAAACLEVASGVPFEKFLRQHVLDPLGMKDTRFVPTEDMLRRLVKAYTTLGGPFRPAADYCNGQLKFPVDHPIYPMPAAGLYSTPADMIRFSQMLAHHGEWKGVRIVSRKTFDEIWAVKQTPANIKETYTVGAWLYGDWFGHGGAMRTDQCANLKTGHSRLFFVQTENRAGKAYFEAKRKWNKACDRAQGMDKPFPRVE